VSSAVAEAPVAPGTVIRSIEQMVDLPAGTVLDLIVSSGNEKWERAAQGGWVCIHRGGTNIALANRVSPIGEVYFAGLMGGELRTAAPPVPAFEVGQALAVGDYTYVVHTVDRNGQAQVGCFRGDAWVGPDSLNPGFLARADVRLTPVENRWHPVWIHRVLASHHRQYSDLLEQRDRAMTQRRDIERAREAAQRETRVAQREVTGLRAEVNTLNEQLSSVREQAASLPREAIEHLHAYARAVDDSEFDSLLTRLSIPRQEQVTVTVRLSGTMPVRLSTTEAATNLGLPESEITDIDNGSTVTWTRTFEVTRSVEPGECACEDVDVDDADVQSHVPGGSDDIEIESVQCPNE
jgi:hypothetical protein